MRTKLAGIIGATAILLGLAPIARANVLVKNRDARPRQIRIGHAAGRTSAEIPGHSMFLITASEQAVSVQIEDRDGNPVGPKVSIEDGDGITILDGAIERKPRPESKDD
jgi:hypothetical protein